MASSKTATQLGVRRHPTAFPARTPGSTGILDRGDPNVHAVKGDSPVQTGRHVHGVHDHPLLAVKPAAGAGEGYPVVSAAQLKAIAPGLASEVVKHTDRLNDAMKEFEINTRLRQAMFLANIAEETGGLTAFTETNKKSFYARYEKRFGNTAAGDGYLYRGRGLVQLTFKGSYRDASDYFKFGERRQDPPRKSGKKLLPGAWHYYGYVDDPDKAADEGEKYRLAGWFWSIYKKTNAVIGGTPGADLADFEKAVRKLNGGLNGYDVRLKYYKLALTALEVQGREPVIKAIDAYVEAHAPKKKAHPHPKASPHADAHGVKAPQTGGQAHPKDSGTGHRTH